MTEAEARARLVMFADAETEPVLSSPEQDMLIQMCKRTDRNRVPPGDSSWEETYDINYAISQAWLVKAGRLARAYLFMSGGKMLNRSQMYDHCMKQYHLFGNKAQMRTIRLSPDLANTLALTPLVGMDDPD